MTYRFILGLLVAASLSGCFGGSGSSATTAASSAATGVGTPSSQVVLHGTPPSGVTVGGNYSFRPSVSSGNSVVTFAVKGQPSWITFDTATGTLSGTPTAQNVGLSGNITITASDGANIGTLAPFTIRVNAIDVGAAAGLTISGTPLTSVVSGNVYSFTPMATDPQGGPLTFSVKNAPSWASFNGATGELSGAPAAANVGTYSNITIAVNDGKTSVSLPAFSIAVTQFANGSATLQWVAPTENTNGTPLTNLAGYRIYYSSSATVMTHTVQVANPGIATYVVSNLSPGTWYFSIRAYTSANVESDASAVASTTIH